MRDHFQKGDPIEGAPEFRERLNRLADARLLLLNVTGDGLIQVRRTANGLTIGLSVDALRGRIPTAGRVPVGGIIMWSGAVADIPDHWALCDGGEYCVEHGIKDHGIADPDCESRTVTTADLSGRFAMGIDEDDGGGEGDEDAIGDMGGYRWHGLTENGHPDHLDHYHTVLATPVESQGGSGSTAHLVTALTTSENDGVYMGEAEVDLRHGGEQPGFHAWGANDPRTEAPWNPTGETHGKLDTDNRPRYYVLAFIQRIQ